MFKVSSIRWFNIYLVEDGFIVGRPFESCEAAEHDADEFINYHETTALVIQRDRQFPRFKDEKKPPVRAVF